MPVVSFMGCHRVLAAVFCDNVVQQVSGDQSGVIKMWDIGYDEEIDHIQAHKGEVVCLHYNAEFPSKLMSGGAYPDDTIKIWDRFSRRMIHDCEATLL